ncbi:hypothetical protein E3J84_06850 [Candidatus Aerophobetes bacterium]|uniref:Uncharacterized protein n=1 Tax=Aerophobetes bacterium TaxID=2030807 RepID=A0A523RQ74_UNCAE|nr:MAG: hypothetical protein E3J84_06850 [Candidatus Aerophobetes bacterium]
MEWYKGRDQKFREGRKYMDNKGLSAKLWVLSKQLQEKVKEYKSSKQLTKTKQLRLKSKISAFDYKEGNISYTTSHSPIIKEEWDLKKFFDFTEKVVKQIPDYHHLALEISKRCEVNEHQADFWLGQFAQTLTRQAFEGLSEETLVDTISMFVNDLDKGLVEWKLKVWVNGVWLEDEEYDIYEGLRVRRTRPSDLEVETPFYLLPYPSEPSPFGPTPSAILELVYRAKEPVAFQDEIENIINCLRLFRLGSVFSIKIKTHPKSILQSGPTLGSGLRFGSTYKYPISKEDIPKLAGLIAKIKVLLPKEIDPVNIALQRYNDALLKPESIESRITSTITCFEALYLKAEERMELSHRLSQRAAALLGFFDFVPLEVYKNLDRAYDVRSTFIHGSLIEAEKHKDIADLAEKTLNYARISLLIFLQLKSLIDKDKFINRIDNSLLDTRAHSKLEEFVKENCPMYS